MCIASRWDFTRSVFFWFILNVVFTNSVDPSASIRARKRWCAGGERIHARDNLTFRRHHHVTATMDSRRHCCDRRRLAGSTMIKAVVNGCPGSPSVRRSGLSGSGSSSGSCRRSGSSDSSDSGSSHSRRNYDTRSSHSGATETLVRRRREIVLILRSDRLFA